MQTKPRTPSDLIDDELLIVEPVTHQEQKPVTDETDEEEAAQEQKKPPAEVDDPFTDAEIAQGFYTTNEMIQLGFIRDRQDQRRKQLKYGFPLPTKTGHRQAPTSKARVHRWIRQRAALSNRLLQK